MPSYRIVKPYNSKVKVGDVIEMESLHPSMASHVVLAADTVAKLAPVVKSEVDDETKDSKETKEGKPLTKAQLEKLHAEALKIDAALFPKDE